MIARLANLRKSPSVFRHLSGVTIRVFEELAAVVVPAVEEAHRKTLDRLDRERALGGGDTFDLSVVDQVLLAVIWRRQYPTTEVLGFLFGVSDSTASRAIARCVPALERAGRDTMRMPDPGRGRRKKLPRLLAGTPGLAVVIDTFEQRTHRPKRRPRAYDSGKKKAHTLKSQLGVDEDTGRIVDVSDSAPGPWSDMKVLKTSRLLERLPKGVGGIGDLAYVGIGALHPDGLGASPRRKPRRTERPPEGRRYNRAFRRRRIVVEHAIGRLQTYRAVSHVNRHMRFPKVRGHEVNGVDSDQGVHRCLASVRRTRPSSSSRA